MPFAVPVRQKDTNLSVDKIEPVFFTKKGLDETLGSHMLFIEYPSFHISEQKDSLASAF